MPDHNNGAAALQRVRRWESSSSLCARIHFLFVLMIAAGNGCFLTSFTSHFTLSVSLNAGEGGGGSLRATSPAPAGPRHGPLIAPRLLPPRAANAARPRGAMRREGDLGGNRPTGRAAGARRGAGRARRRFCPPEPPPRPGARQRFRRTRPIGRRER